MITNTTAGSGCQKSPMGPIIIIIIITDLYSAFRSEDTESPLRKKYKKVKVKNYKKNK